MSKYDSGRAYRMDGINIEARRSDALNGIRFNSNRSALPSSANDFVLFRHGNALKVWDGTSTVTIIAGGALGGIPSFETIFQNDATFDVAGTTVTIDNSAGNNDVLTLTNTGAGSGDVIQITNVGTGNDIQGTSNTWKVTKAGVATFAGISISGTSSAFTSTGAAVWTLLDNSATALSIGASGDTNIMVISTDNTTPEVIFNDNLRVEGGLATFISASNTVSNVLVTNNTITTFGVTQAASAGAVVIRSTSLTTGTLLRLQLAETALNGGFYLEALDSEGGGTSVFTIGEDGRVAIGGVEGSNMLTITLGDAVISDGSLSITDDDNASSLSVVNNTATTAAVLSVVSTTAVFTGTTTGSYAHISHSGLTTGTLLRLTAVAADTSVGVVDIATMGLTSGSAFRITANTGVFTTGGKLIELSSTAAVAGNLLTATTTGAYTGTGMILVTAGAATTGVLVSVISTTGLTSGSLIRATSSTAGALATNGAISFTATGNFTSTSAVNGGFVEVKANTTTAGTIVNVTGTSLTTGIGLQLSNGTSGMTTGSLLRVTASGTGTVATNGIVSITHGGIFVSTSNAGVLDVRATAMVGTASNGTLVNFMTTAAAQVDTTVLNVENSGFTTGYTGSMLRIKSPTTTGACRVVDLIADGITAGGTAMKISVAALTTGDGLVIDNGTAATTTGSLLKVTAGGVGAISSDGLVSFQHSGIYTSTTVGFVNVSASATTGGTVMTVTGAGVTDGTGFQISNVGITTGKHLNILGAAGASVFSVSANGATVIAGDASGTAALTLTEGDIVLAAGNVEVVGGITSSSPTGQGVGYATGAGGTVTQITNRSTGVTINTLCGKIQTDTTSLAAGASAEFTVTNSTVAIGDVVVVSQRSGSSTVDGVAGTLIVEVVTVAAGSFIISLNNNSSTTAETGAVVINFAVIKAVTA